MGFVARHGIMAEAGTGEAAVRMAIARPWPGIRRRPRLGFDRWRRRSSDRNGITKQISHFAPFRWTRAGPAPSYENKCSTYSRYIPAIHPRNVCIDRQTGCGTLRRQWAGHRRHRLGMRQDWQGTRPRSPTEDHPGSAITFR